MKRRSFCILILAFVVASDPAASQTPVATADSVRALPQLAPVVRVGAGGVRIRSIRDNRRIVILRPPVRVVLPMPARSAAPPEPFQPDLAGGGTMTLGDLERMEARLLDYMDQRFLQLERGQRVAAPQVGAEISPIHLSRPSAPRGRVPVPVPVPVPIGGAPDTVVSDTTAVAATPDTMPIAAPDTTPRPLVAGPETIRTVPSVVEVERAILDTGLLRTVNVVFEFNEAKLMPASAVTLHALGVVLERYPDVSLEIGGHTDSSGSADYNLGLSQRRAEAVRDYLLRTFSIDPQRLHARGYGETRPIADDGNATGRTLNRRVEFTVLNQPPD